MYASFQQYPKCIKEPGADGVSNKSASRREDVGRCNKTWSEMPLSTVARAYAGHHQIAITILEHNEGNEFLSD
jgi:hypothetical protein